MKIYTVDFVGHWPVPNALVIAANTLAEAVTIATDTINNAGLSDSQESPITVKEVRIKEPGVILFESGEY